MSKFLFLVSLAFLGLFNRVSAQATCGQEAYLKYLESIQPGVQKQLDSAFFAALGQSKIKTKNEGDTVLEIKVVFHIVYNNQTQNIDDSLIFKQLKVMNEAFRRTNSDTSETRDIFKPVAADARIEFVLAKIDPNGNPTTGIVRQQSIRPFFGSSPVNLGFADLVKGRNVGSEAWNTREYLNIWICDLSANGSVALLGFAYPPVGAANWNGAYNAVAEGLQGVVCHYEVVGENTFSQSSTGNKTMVHEVGHYLGLRHIWGDGGCAVDDYMDDTPIARRANSGCNKGTNTCIEPGGEDLPDMIENYMDYSSQDCQNTFTNDQVAQMRTNLRLFRNRIYEEQISVDSIELVKEVVTQTAVYPNPTVDGRVMIYMSEVSSEETYTFALYNLLGQVVYQKNIAAVERQELADLQEFRGSYIYQIKTRNDVLLTGKLMMGW